MLSSPLIQKIEHNWETIALQVIAQRARDPRLPHYRTLADSELRERARDLVENLAKWLETHDDGWVERTYQSLGRRRFYESIPLHEVIHKTNLVNRQIRQFAVDENLELTPVEIYAEMELLRHLAAFFDLVLYGISKGYESALRESDGEDLRRQVAALTEPRPWFPGSLWP
jgi:hypothetical protein